MPGTPTERAYHKEQQERHRKPVVQKSAAEMEALRAKIREELEPYRKQRIDELVNRLRGNR